MRPAGSAIQWRPPGSRPSAPCRKPRALVVGDAIVVLHKKNAAYRVSTEGTEHRQPEAPDIEAAEKVDDLFRHRRLRPLRLQPLDGEAAV